MHTQVCTFQWLFLFFFWLFFFFPVALSKSFSPPFLLFPCSHIGCLIFLKYRRQAPAPGPLHLIFPLPVTFQISSIFFHFFVALAQLLPSVSEIPSLTMQYTKWGYLMSPLIPPHPHIFCFPYPNLLFSVSHIWQTWPMNLRLLSHVLEDLVLRLFCDPFPIFFFLLWFKVRIKAVCVFCFVLHVNVQLF